MTYHYFIILQLRNAEDILFGCPYISNECFQSNYQLHVGVPGIDVQNVQWERIDVSIFYKKIDKTISYMTALAQT